MLFNRKVSAFLIVTFIIIIQGCVDKPADFFAPTWETEVNVKITTKEFSLLEIVEKDSSLLKSSTDPTTLGLIYFGDEEEISTISIEENLKLDPFETSFSQTIGPIKINMSTPIESVVKLSEWAVDVPPGTSIILPEQEGHINVEIGGIESVESITIEEGKLNVNVKNDLPIPIQLHGMIIRNAGDLSVIAELPANDNTKWVSIASRQSKEISFNLVEGTIITNLLEYEGTLFSNGSNGQFVVINASDGTNISATFDNLIISSATAVLPSQKFQIDDSIVLDDSTKIESALIKEGSAELKVDNNLNVNLTATINFINLFDDADNQYQQIVKINKNEQNKIIEIPTMNNWTVRTTTPGIPTNEISYSVNVVTDSTNTLSTINKNDSISFVLNFNELFFESFTGLLKPTTFKLDDSGFKLDYGNVKDKLKYGDINFKDAAFHIDFVSSADIDIVVNGEVFATNGLNTNSLEISDINLPSSEPVKIDISSLINGFSTELPDSFSMIGEALLNPNFKIGTVSAGDSVFGNIDFEVPLNVGISQGSFIDTIDIELGDVDEDDIDQLNYGEVTITITNEVPVDIDLFAQILDSNYTKILDLPTEYNNIDVIEIPKPEVSSNGDIMLAGQKVQTLKLLGEDIKHFLNNPYLLLDIKFKTAGESVEPVKFKTTNKISFDVRVKAEYNVEL